MGYRDSLTPVDISKAYKEERGKVLQSLNSSVEQLFININ